MLTRSTLTAGHLWPLAACAALLCAAGPLLESCVPRERPGDDTGKPAHKAPRATSVASRQQIPEVQPLSPGDGGPGRRALPAPRGSASAAAPKEPPLAVDAPLTSPFMDSFDRADLGADWRAMSSDWHLEGARLCVENAHNHPLWLKRKLPTNASIEFSATSYSDEGDIKVEMWGDGHSAAKGVSYNDATGYIAIFGGWRNSFHVLARLNEHAPDRPEINLTDTDTDPRTRKVESGTEYHFKILRSDGKTMRWLVDDIELFSWSDKQPLRGIGHDHFGFNDWQVKVCFDNLKIVPLPGP